MTCCDRALADTIACTAATAPTAPGAANGTRPVRLPAATAPAIAAATWNVASRGAVNQAQRARLASDTSVDHHLLAAPTNHGVEGGISPDGAGNPAARTAPNAPRPAQSAAATSSIERIEQPHWVAHRGELCAHTIWHRRRRADPMPAAVMAVSNQLLHRGTSIVHALYTADRKQPPAPRLACGVGSPNYSRVDDQVDRMHDFGQHGVRPRRLRVSQRHAHESRQGFARTVGVDRADRPRMPSIS